MTRLALLSISLLACGEVAASPAPSSAPSSISNVPTRREAGPFPRLGFDDGVDFDAGASTPSPDDAAAACPPTFASTVACMQAGYDGGTSSLVNGCDDAGASCVRHDTPDGLSVWCCP